MRFLFWRAFFLVMFYDILLARDDFPGIHRRVERYPLRKGKNAPITKLAEEDTVDTVCRALNNACVWYPRRAECLQRSAVVTCLLRRYGVPAQMVIGTQKLPFRAHAWVELNGRVINDKQDMPQLYAEIARC
ncbi:MAG TPA: lasso peptide biosynthesis B2 protein [Candidatus Polarisedimenticolia bacterium]|nr:lasso peptide biosynthesis B2 protein [Candidatus Polarisedimenticolia bacterium]